MVRTKADASVKAAVKLPRKNSVLRGESFKAATAKGKYDNYAGFNSYCPQRTLSWQKEIIPIFAKNGSADESNYKINVGEQVPGCSKKSIQWNTKPKKKHSSHTRKVYESIPITTMKSLLHGISQQDNWYICHGKSGKYAGGNSYCSQPTPTWKKPIPSNFAKNVSADESNGKISAGKPVLGCSRDGEPILSSDKGDEEPVLLYSKNKKKNIAQTKVDDESLVGANMNEEKPVAVANVVTKKPDEKISPVPISMMREILLGITQDDNWFNS